MQHVVSVRACLGPAGPSGRGLPAPLRRPHGHDTSVRRRVGRPGTSGVRAAGSEPAEPRHARGGRRRAESESVKEATPPPADVVDGQEGGDAGEGADSETIKGQTELIFKLERRGSGWGEEILPHLTVEQREVQPPARRNRRRAGAPEPWEDGSLEWFLEKVGVPADAIERVVIDAVAWRVTSGGRLLIDRRRRARVERNMMEVAEYLLDPCGVPLEGLAKVITAFPKLLLCKPSHNDSWNRRFIDLAAYVYFHGNCNVPEQIPEEWPQFKDLPQWVKRQRQSFDHSELLLERQQMLTMVGFKFAQIAAITEEWEELFDELMEWKMWHEAEGVPMSWDLLRWGQAGGPQARRLAIWVQLQREFVRRGLLPPEGRERLEYVGVQWEQPPDTDPQWLARFGQLIYLQEEALEASHMKKLVAEMDFQKKSTTGRQVAPKTPRVRVGWRRRVHSSGGRQMEANLPGTAVAAGRAEEADGGESRRSRRSPPVQFSAVPSQELEVELEPGVRFWLAKQRWLWRAGRLPREEMLLMGYAAVDMDVYGEAEWRAGADAVAAMMAREEARSAGPAAGAATPIAMARWVLTQNALWRQKGLSPPRLAAIREAGLSWVLPDEVLHMGNAQWVRRFQDVADLVQAHGPEGAARRLPANLRDWIRLQRYLRCLALLPAERAALFAQVDIDLAEPGSSSWEANFKDLLAFRQEYGHCEVPSRWERNPFLPVWLRLQLQRMREGELPEEYIEQLVEAGVLDSS
mmetsp:Transcript_37594/g.96186  ORF Transcript_37594/g.96186 Transcript_37594/m.96186 type:complete len:748 (-) Transcript_37594:129-2372(-)